MAFFHYFPLFQYTLSIFEYHIVIPLIIVPSRLFSYLVLFSPCLISISASIMNTASLPPETHVVSDGTDRLVQHCINHHDKRVPMLDAAVVRQAIVDGGADVHRLFQLTPVPAEFGLTLTVTDTILHYVLLHGTVDCIAALLLSAKPIDFSTVNGKGIQALYVLHSRSDTAEVAAIVDLVVKRLQTHSEEDHHGLGQQWFADLFFSRAVVRGRLSLFWMKLKPLLPRDAAMKVSRKVALEDYKQLAEEDHCHFEFSKGVSSCPERTAKLVTLLMASSHPDVGAVAACVEEYADVFTEFPVTSDCLLSYALRECGVECVAALLKTKMVIPFSFTFSSVFYRHSVEEMQAVLQKISERVAKRKHERPYLHGFLGCAAKCGVLSDVWPSVRDDPQLSDYFHTIRKSPNQLRLWSFDWETFCSDNKNTHPFHSKSIRVCYSGSRETAALARLSCHRSPDPLLVEQCIRAGADVHFDWEGCFLTTRLILSGTISLLDNGGTIVIRKTDRDQLVRKLDSHTVVPATQKMQNGLSLKILLHRFFHEWEWIRPEELLDMEWWAHIPLSVRDRWKRKSENVVNGVVNFTGWLIQTLPEKEAVKLSRDKRWIINVLLKASMCGFLAPFWEQLKRWLPNSATTIDVNEAVSVEDFRSLPEEDRPRFLFSGGFRGAASRTEELSALLATSHSPDIHAVRAFVQAYTDVSSPFVNNSDSLLSHALRECSVNCIAALLDTPLPLPISFSFSTLCERHCESEVKEVLELVVERLGKCPNERQLTSGLLRRAAECGVLTHVWPILSQLPSIQNRLPEGKPVTMVLSHVWEYDWVRLQATYPQYHQHFFTLSTQCIPYPHTPSTAALARLSCSHRPDPSLVEEYLCDGATLNVVWSGIPLLSRLIDSGSVEAVAAALRCEEPIDFTLGNPDPKEEVTRGSMSVLHHLCDLKENAVVAAMLDLVVHRLQCYPEDVCDLDMRDAKGLTLLDRAALKNRLALFWSRLQDLPYYTDTTSGIRITTKVSRRDAELLGKDLACFSIPETENEVAKNTNDYRNWDQEDEEC